MQGYASTGADFGSRTADQVEDWMHSASEELRHAVTYVDTVIVPEVRRESAAAMRMLAAQFEQWADKLDPAGKRQR